MGPELTGGDARSEVEDPSPLATADLTHIGRVAEIVGHSVRTIRHYEEMGLVTPSGRTPGGFRLYNAEDIARLLLIKRMKPLGYPLEEMARLLRLIDALTRPGDTELSREDAVEHLRSYIETVQERIADLRIKVEYAEEFRDGIRAEIQRWADHVGTREARE